MRDWRVWVPLVAVAAVLSTAPAANAQDTGRVPLGATITTLFSDSGGGAWIASSRPAGGSAVGRALPQGGLRLQRVREELRSATLGPDGRAWFTGGRTLYRADAAGAVTRVAQLPADPLGDYHLAAGPDGTLWALPRRGDRLTRVTVQGTVSTAAIEFPACPPAEYTGDTLIVDGLVRAADGAVWVLDLGCERLLRIGPAGITAVVVYGIDTQAVAPDPIGGLWFAAVGDAPLRHIDATGTIREFPRPEDVPSVASDVAAAPDGGAVFAFDDCTLARVSASGEVTSLAAPIPARHVAFAPGGGLWLAGRTRLVHLAPGAAAGPCDATGPPVRFHSPRRMSLAALRRGGVRFSVRGPAALAVQAFYFEDRGSDDDSGHLDKRVTRRAVSGRYRVSPRQLRRFARSLAAGKRPIANLRVEAVDADGNLTAVERAIRVTR